MILSLPISIRLLPPDLLSDAESNIRITLTHVASGTAVTLVGTGSDTTEPYSWTPSNSAELVALVNAVIADADKLLQISVSYTPPAGSGAAIDSIAVDAQGRITGITWQDGGSGYAAGDTLTLTQGQGTMTYALLAADIASGVLQDLSGKTLAGVHTFATTPVPVVSGGSGKGATIDSIAVDAQGRITGIVWQAGDSGYVAGDTLTLTQGQGTTTYTLLAADIAGGGSLIAIGADEIIEAGEFYS